MARPDTPERRRACAQVKVNGAGGQEWRYRRDACPVCENSDPGNREIIHVRKQTRERVEASNSCKTYLLCVDLRDFEQKPVLTAAPLGLIHLPLLARDRNYQPVSPAPWNTFGPAERAEEVCLG